MKIKAAQELKIHSSQEDASQFKPTTFEYIFQICHSVFLQDQF